MPCRAVFLFFFLSPFALVKLFCYTRCFPFQPASRVCMQQNSLEGSPIHFGAGLSCFQVQNSGREWGTQQLMAYQVHSEWASDSENRQQKTWKATLEEGRGSFSCFEVNFANSVRLRSRFAFCQLLDSSWLIPSIGVCFPNYVNEHFVNPVFLWCSSRMLYAFTFTQQHTDSACTERAVSFK